MMNALGMEARAVKARKPPIRFSHIRSIHEHQRIDFFNAAIARAVSDGDKVIVFGDRSGRLSQCAVEHGAHVWHLRHCDKAHDLGLRTQWPSDIARRIEFVDEHAANYLPAEPIDVVVSDMLHAGMLRWPHVAVLRSFAERYLEQFGAPLPTLIPFSSSISIEPVEHQFGHSRLGTPTPHFQSPGVFRDETLALGDAVRCTTIDYRRPLRQRIGWSGQLTITRRGRLTGLCMRTQHTLARPTQKSDGVEWLDQLLLVPLSSGVQDVQPRQIVDVTLSYDAGGSLESLLRSLTVELDRTAILRRRAA